MAFLLVLTGLVALALLAGRFGADSRRRDPRSVEREWPFGRRDGC